MPIAVRRLGSHSSGRCRGVFGVRGAFDIEEGLRGNVSFSAWIGGWRIAKERGGGVGGFLYFAFGFGIDFPHDSWVGAWADEDEEFLQLWGLYPYHIASLQLKKGIVWTEVAMTGRTLPHQTFETTFSTTYNRQCRNGNTSMKYSVSFPFLRNISMKIYICPCFIYVCIFLKNESDSTDNVMQLTKSREVNQHIIYRRVR